MRKLRRELSIRRAKNGFVLKVDIEQIVVYLNKEDLLWDVDKILDAETKDATQVRDWQETRAHCDPQGFSEGDA